MKDKTTKRDVIEAQERVSLALEKLRHLHPDKSAKQLTGRLAGLAREDKALANDIALLTVRGVLNELYDEAAREGRAIPESLRRPS